MEKYGFIYIWYDRKHKRYYIGAHWGHESDGYICSSTWMKQAYKHRPNDFRRRILLKNIATKKEMFETENKWLELIQPDEFGKKYYNLQKHWMHWSSDEEKRRSTAEKISQHHKNYANWGKWGKGKTLSNETKELLRQANKKQFEDEQQIKMRQEKSLALWDDPEYRRINSENKRGVKQTQETKEKKIRSLKERWAKTPKKGTLWTEERKKKHSEQRKEMLWINDGVTAKMIHKDTKIPVGFVRGRTLDK
jgi:hypothetical protein